MPSGKETAHDKNHTVIEIYMIGQISANIFALLDVFNRLTPNDPYMGRTAPLTSKRCILYIYSTNIGTEYFNPYPTNVENRVSS